MTTADAHAGCRSGPKSPVLGASVLASALIRHPLMTGFIIVFWATPAMTAGHLLFAAAATAYILVGIGLEERDLGRDLGSVYISYRSRVPALIPGLRRPGRPD